jgi:hypothetical protein
MSDFLPVIFDCLIDDNKQSRFADRMNDYGAELFVLEMECDKRD